MRINSKISQKRYDYNDQQSTNSQQQAEKADLSVRKLRYALPSLPPLPGKYKGQQTFQYQHQAKCQG